jgi:peptide/nickel transport system substrate-binding protein
VRPWVKRFAAVAVGVAVATSTLAAPAAAETNKITVAETTGGSVGLEQIASPWVNSGAIAQTVMFRALFRADANLTTVKPDLASGYKLSSDRKTVTITMKSGLKWSDGRAITADDVVWSINTLLRVAQSNALYVNAFKGIVGSESVSAAGTGTLSGLTASGSTITMQLTAPQSTLIPILAQFVILPKHVLENEDVLKLASNNFWKDPVTSGPFKVGTFSQGNFITLVPNANYEGPRPKITEINVVKSANLVADAKAGKIDYFFSNDAETIGAMSAVDNFTSNPVNLPFYRYFVFNLKQPGGPFNKVKAREALQYGVDWNNLVRILYPNGKVINSGVTKGMPDHLSSIPAYKYDVAKAKRLLKEAKFDFSKTVRLRHYYSDATSITFMTAIAQQMKKLGIKAEMLRFQGDATTELYTNRNYDIALKGLGAFSVAEWYAEYSNTATFQQIIGAQPRFAELNVKLNEAATAKERTKVLTDLQKLEQATRLKMPLHSLRQYIFVSKRVSGTGKFGNPLYMYDNNFANWTAKN